MEINLKNIKGNQLINILDNIFQQEHINGVISCKNNDFDISSKIFIKDGHVAYAVSSMYQAKFGDIMVKKGIISNSELLDALKIQKENKEKKLIGNILVEIGVITEKVIPNLLYNQIEVVIYEILSWNDLDIEFQETDVEKHPEYNSPVSDYEEKFSYGELMKLFDSKAFLGILKNNVVELINIRQNIPNPYAIPKRIVKTLPNDLTFEQRKILRGVDGINSINDIIILSDLDYFETYKTLNFLCSEKIILIPDIDQDESDKHISKLFSPPSDQKDDNINLKALEQENIFLKKKVSDYDRFFQLIGKETLFLLKQFPDSKKESLNSILRNLIEISRN